MVAAARATLKLPTVSPFLAWGFGWYVCHYLRRHFNAVRVAQESWPELSPDEPVVCFANHPGWWDPLVAYFLNGQFLGGRTAYAPIDESALRQYPVFRKLGFYGVELKSLAGAKQFLSVTRALLTHATTAIWITPGGKFADVRTQTTFQSGLGHLAAAGSDITLLPVAVEYTFWEERTAEVLIEFGRPVRTRSKSWSKVEWQNELEQQLADAQARLAKKAISRDPIEFVTVLGGSAGVGGWYDVARRGRSLLTGTKFNPRHGQTPLRNGDG
jgi:1-acyl-sn-glycerol-3-phosphate acyltransferase